MPAHPSDIDDLRPLQLGREGPASVVAAQALHAGGLRGLDLAADDLPLEIPPDGLDLRKLVVESADGAGRVHGQTSA